MKRPRFVVFSVREAPAFFRESTVFIDRARRGVLKYKESKYGGSLPFQSGVG